MIPGPFVRALLRRVRVESALALGEQNRLPEADLARLSQRLADADEEAARLAEEEDGRRFLSLSGRLGLGVIDQRVLAACLALELDPLLAITLSALLGEEPQRGLSPRALAQLFRASGDEALGLRLDRFHPLVRSGLLEPWGDGTGPETLRPHRLSVRARQHLLGDDAPDALLTRAGGLVEVPEGIELGHVEAARAVVEGVIAAGEAVAVLLEGATGSGRRTLVAAVAAAAGRPVVALDLGRVVPERARLVQLLRALRRECWLRGAVAVVAGLDALPSDETRRGELHAEIVDALDGDGGLEGPFFLTAAPGAALPRFSRRILRTGVPLPSRSERERIWRAALGPVEAALEAALPEVAQLYGLAPGGIVHSARNARILAGRRAPDLSAVRAGVRAEVQERFGDLARRVEVEQGWDDLVLPTDTLDDVKAFAARAHHAALVYDQWGFRRKLQKGLGLSALFSGPPGTGKTMVAGIIARSLGLELYMVDLSQVVSKWVGETEKQLGRIFDGAQMGNVLLLFDEADALFAKRTEVKSSNDRYANLEVNYLLLRLEQFAGVAILTTNLETSVDPAFRRRLAADVRFYPPEVRERALLWRGLLPDEVPRADGLDPEALAERYKDMCGGHIRNAVLRAAFLAASEGGRITQVLLERAAQSEYRAMGKVL